MPLNRRQYAGLLFYLCFSAIFRTASGRLQAIAGVGAGRGGGGRRGDSLCGVQCRWREGEGRGGGIVQSAAGSALSNEYNFKQSNCVWRQTPS